MARYEAIYGFNTKQWWAYDTKTKKVCDPPTVVLKEIETFSSNIDDQQEYFEHILDTLPDWLNDEDYRYPDDFDL